MSPFDSTGLSGKADDIDSPIFARATLVSWAQALEDARSVPISEIRTVVEQRLLFEDRSVGAARRVVHVSDPSALPASLWFIGDLHGDLLGLANAWAYIQAQSRVAGCEPFVLFLGDFVDRGVHAHETLLYLFRMIRDNPGRVGVLPGNHDEIAWDTEANRFRSEVNPADYVDGLNAILDRGPSDDEDAARIEVGKLACTFFANRPRAVFLPDGLLVAHAGFPHADLLPTLKAVDDLNAGDCLQDFVWLRISENAPRKRPNRATKGCEFGYENFSEFCTVATQRLGVTTRRMIRGHEHPPSRFATYPNYQRNPVLTINTMCRRMDDESSLRVERFPKACIARHVPDELPCVHQLPIGESEVSAAYYHDATPAEAPAESSGSTEPRLVEPSHPAGGA